MSELMIYKPCKTGNAFQATSKEKIFLDMDKVATILREKNYKVKLQLRDVVIAEKGYTFDIFREGRILIKEIKDSKEAQKKISEIFNIIKAAKRQK